MKKIGIYIRKSTDTEDNQALSLAKQRESCEDLLRGLGTYEVVQVWEESVSAKATGKRPGFQEMLRSIEKGKIDTIVTWKMSRLARNSLDQAYIETYLQEGKIQLIVSQDGIFRPDDNILLMRIFFGMATQYSRDLGKDASQGMLTKVKGGQPVKVPRGYEFNNKKEAIPSHDAEAIRDMYRLKRRGYTLSEISAHLYHNHGLESGGKPIHSSVIQGMINNPIYYGAIKYMGEIFEGNFKPLVSFSEWEEANETNGIQREKNPGVDFARNLIFNKLTGNPLAPFLSKGNLYFRSTERSGPKINISFNFIVDYFDRNIESYCIPEEYKQYLIEGYREYCTQKQGGIVLSRENINKSLKQIDKKKASLLDMRMNEELDSCEYLKIKNELTREYQIQIDNLTRLNELNDEIMEKGDECFKLLVDLSQTWKQANLIRKASLIRMLCFKLEIDDKKALYLAERGVFREVRNMRDSVWLGKLEISQTPVHSLYMEMILYVSTDHSYHLLGVS